MPPDIDDPNSEPNPDSNPDNPRDLRNQLEAALASNKELKSTITNLQAASLMPSLNDRQRRVIMRELTEDKLELTEDNVKNVAEDLGYNLTPEPTPPTPTSAPSTNGQPLEQPEQDEEVLVSLASMNAIDQAHYNAQRGNINPDLETKMKNAKTKEELRHIIRTEGHKSGIVHEWDDE